MTLCGNHDLMAVQELVMSLNERRTPMQFKDKVVIITGENICIDGGMTRQMIYHGEHGWRLEDQDV